MKIDRNKGITDIAYNHLNLPTTVAIANTEHTGNISYIYDATGTKLKKIVTEGSSLTTEYAGNYVYKNGELQYFSTPEGYAEPNNNNGFNYVYQYADHLGNIRLSYKDVNKDGSITQNEIIEENNYYPFGLKHEGYNNIITSTSLGQKEKTFQGQRFDDDLGLNWHTFKWRNYDASLARFHNIDPLAEEFVYNSPYNFAENRVIDGVELEGLEWENFMSKFKKTSNLKVKPTPSGKGTQNQSYNVVVQNPKKALKDLRSTFKDKPQDVLNSSSATFQPVDKNGDDLERANLREGSDIEIAIDGPMNNSAVRVTNEESDDNSFSFTFSTLEGHIEAGNITFSATQNEEGDISFSINSVSKVDLGIGPEGYMRKKQTESWLEVLTNVVNYLGGTEQARSHSAQEQKDEDSQN